MQEDSRQNRVSHDSLALFYFLIFTKKHSFGFLNAHPFPDANVLRTVQKYNGDGGVWGVGRDFCSTKTFFDAGHFQNS